MKIDPKQIVGTWKLVKYEITTPEGVTRPWGQDVVGQLIYSEDGYMSGAINRKPDPTERDDFKARIRSFLFYSGKYTLEDKVITHHVSNASLLERIGRDEVRQISFVDGDLVLQASGDFGHARLQWRRANT